MNFSLQHNGTILIQELDIFLATLLSSSFQKKDFQQKVLQEHLPQKMKNQDLKYLRDWKEYIEPELETLFNSSQRIVLEAITRMQHHQQEDPNHLATLTITLEAREAWLRMLSMARLALMKEHHFTSQELEESNFSTASPERGRALLQMQLLAVIQQTLIEVEEQTL